MKFLKKGLSILLACLVFFSIVITNAIQTSNFEPVFAQETSVIAQIPTVKLNQLPAEAKTTLKLIDQGGPFPYPEKDGSTFYNRERLLPNQPRGYYREYTIPTPGVKNRGAQRFVVGKQGEIYYTNNHYQSFVIVLRQ